MDQMRRCKATQRGFTLAEMLTVVVMVGILATLAVWGIRKYIGAAKSSEAPYMIGNIKAAQEHYKDETFAYLDASQGNVASNYFPQGSMPNGKKYDWHNWSHSYGPAFRTLNVEAAGPVQFGYATVAGIAGGTPPAPPITETSLTYPATTDVWYEVVAVADRNEDGTRAVFVSSSFTSEIYFEREHE